MHSNHDFPTAVDDGLDEAVDPKAGEPASAEALVRTFNRSLVRVLQLRLSSYEDAREVAQEAYARLLNLDGGRVVSYHRAYLFRIAHNLVTDILRRRAYMETPDQDVLDVWPDPGADPEGAAHAAQVAERLPALLAELPPRCSEAFRLVRVEQLGFREAAERMGLTERMIRLHVARALAHCQSRLDGAPAPGGSSL